MAAKKSPKSTPPGKEVGIIIPPLHTQQFSIELEGLSPLIVHAWSQKAKEEMLAKQMKKAVKKKEAKDPKADYEACFYYMPDGKTYAFPSIAFKKAAVSACSHVQGITKVEARGAFHILQEMIEIKGKPRRREDMVRIAMGTADIRFRPEFPKWSCTLVVTYNPDILTVEQIVNLFNMAGFGVGIGEWRPQKDGQYGMFKVKGK